MALLALVVILRTSPSLFSTRQATNPESKKDELTTPHISGGNGPKSAPQNNGNKSDANTPQDKTGTLHIKVLDSRNRPVEGASVSFSYARGGAGRREWRSIGGNGITNYGATDRDGIVRLRLHDKAEEWPNLRVKVEAKNFASQTVQLKRSGPEEIRIEVVLKEGVTVRGMLTGVLPAHLKSASRFLVSASSRESSWGEFGNVTEDGAFILECAPSEKLTITISDTLDYYETAEVEANPPFGSINVALEPVKAIGQVSLEVTGLKGEASLKAEFYSHAKKRNVQHEYVSRTGTATASLPEGRYTAYVATHFLLATDGLAGIVQFDVTKGMDQKVVCEVRPTSRIALTAIDSNTGKDISEFAATIIVPLDAENLIDFGTAKAKNGELIITSLVPGAILTIQATGYRTHQYQIPAGDGEKPIQIKMVPE